MAERRKHCLPASFAACQYMTVACHWPAVFSNSFAIQETLHGKTPVCCWFHLEVDVLVAAGFTGMSGHQPIVVYASHSSRCLLRLEFLLIAVCCHEVCSSCARSVLDEHSLFSTLLRALNECWTCTLRKSHQLCSSCSRLQRYNIPQSHFPHNDTKRHKTT